MEVSKQKLNLVADLAVQAAPQEMSGVAPEHINENLGGQQLIETLVSLTGLPAPLAHQELDQILEMSGCGEEQDRAELTLDQLRAALITYLEAFQPAEDE